MAQFRTAQKEVIKLASLLPQFDIDESVEPTGAVAAPLQLVPFTPTFRPVAPVSHGGTMTLRSNSSLV